MTDFKAGDKVLVRDHLARRCDFWTAGKVYTVNEGGYVHDDRGIFFPAVTSRFTSAPDADGWYPMPTLKAGDPIPEWLVDRETQYRIGDHGSLYAGGIRLEDIVFGADIHYRPAPKTEIATTADGKEYRITHNPDGSVSAEVV